MIEKERLEELAKKEAIIYKIEKEILIAGYSSTLKIIPIKLDKDFLNIKMYDVLNDLFETKEEAEWVLEFGNITREEKLSLPKWEKIKYDDIGYFIYKFHIKNNYNFFGKLMLWKMNNGTGKIVVEEMVQGWQEKIYFEKPLTKENYIEACRLCKQLFLGEKENEI